MNRRIDAWNKAALELGQKTGDWKAVTLNSPEYVEWELYFNRLGFKPWAFQRLSQKGQEAAVWTAPCQWPVWFPDDWETKKLHKPKNLLIAG